LVRYCPGLRVLTFAACNSETLKRSKLLPRPSPRNQHLGRALHRCHRCSYLALTSPFSSRETPKSALNAIEIGLSTCEQNQCDGTVGFGGSPDEAYETTPDALIIDDTTLWSGAVAGLRRIRDTVLVARTVLRYTRHSLLVGDLATWFAVENGFGPKKDLSTKESRSVCKEWRKGGYKGNYRVRVEPDPAVLYRLYRPLLPA
jgi:N4-(beta-N-acetylglucosaminyl)-L-asparaginase